MTGDTVTMRRLTTTLGSLAEAMAAEGVRPPAVWVVGDVVDVAADPSQMLAPSGGGPSGSGAANPLPPAAGAGMPTV